MTPSCSGARVTWSPLGDALGSREHRSPLATPDSLRGLSAAGLGRYVALMEML
jgi:hypothetical protein